VLVMLSLAAASLASLLVMAAARVFPARRVAEVLGFVVGTTMFVFSQSSRFVQFDVTDQQMTRLLHMTERFNQPWSPLSWAGQGLVDVGQGHWLAGAGLMAATLLVTGLVFGLALSTSERLYFSGWASLQNNRRKPRARANGKAAPVARPARENRVARLIPTPLRAILVKDLLVYRRDLRNLSQLVTPLILGVVYAIGLLQTGGQGVPDDGETPSLVRNAVNSLLIYGDVALALFLGWMLAANLAGRSFSHEGRNYWLLKTAPLSARQLLMAKFLVAFLPTLIVCGVYLVVLQLLKGESLPGMLVSLVSLAFMLAGLTGIYLSFGVQGAKFNWESPQQMGNSVGCLGTLAGLFYLPLCFLLFIGPNLATSLLDLPAWVGQLVGLLLGGAAGVAGVVIPLGLVEKRVPRLAEG
jgi:ABC-2 type transport system permease protein